MVKSCRAIQAGEVVWEEAIQPRLGVALGRPTCSAAQCSAPGDPS